MSRPRAAITAQPPPRAAVGRQRQLDHVTQAAQARPGSRTSSDVDRRSSNPKLARSVEPRLAAGGCRAAAPAAVSCVADRRDDVGRASAAGVDGIALAGVADRASRLVSRWPLMRSPRHRRPRAPSTSVCEVLVADLPSSASASGRVVDHDPDALARDRARSRCRARAGRARPRRSSARRGVERCCAGAPRSVAACGRSPALQVADLVAARR